MAILEINRGDGMQSTNRSADIAMVSRTGDPATGESSATRR
jgi:hypothetical protein